MALFVHESDGFHPTAYSVGPWDDRFLHGGPPSGLLTRALEQHGERADMQLVRVCVDLLRPIPRLPLRVQLVEERIGGQAHWLTARLIDPADRVLARATGLKIRVKPSVLPARHTAPLDPPPGPETVAPFVFPFFRAEIAFHKAVDIRLVQGTWPDGPVTAWMRLVQPLLAGERTSPVQATVVMCDAINGVSPALPMGGFTFVNADLTVHLRRPAVGDWLGMHARSIAEPTGIGQVQATLFDGQGEIGRCVESLVIRPV